MVDRLKVLNENKIVDFWGFNEPKCPFCLRKFELKANIVFEGKREIECPFCKKDFLINIHILH